jgi:hypothetical protein
VNEPLADGRHSVGAREVAARVVAMVRDHPVVTAVLLAGAAVTIGLSAYTGLPLYFTMPILVVSAVIGWLLYRAWRRRRPADRPLSSALAGRAGFVAVAVGAALTFGLIQLVPYGRAHSNPPGSGEPAWATPRTRELVKDACYGCHSSEVDYPFYASIAPISWLVQQDVEQGRDELNFSDFVADPGEADDAIEVIEEGEMPPARYTRFGLHPEADLTEAERQELIEGLRATPGFGDRDGRGRHRGRGGHDDD